MAALGFRIIEQPVNNGVVLTMDNRALQNPLMLAGAVH